MARPKRRRMEPEEVNDLVELLATYFDGLDLCDLDSLPSRVKIKLALTAAGEGCQPQEAINLSSMVA